MRNKSINYLEVPSLNLQATKQFFQSVFSWQFTDYGDAYTAFESPEILGGFFLSDTPSLTKSGATLIVFYSDDLEACESDVKAAGGEIIKPIFSFPGGRRFHFCEPGGSEFAVWSE